MKGEGEAREEARSLPGSGEEKGLLAELGGEIGEREESKVLGEEERNGVLLDESEEENGELLDEEEEEEASLVSVDDN